MNTEEIHFLRRVRKLISGLSDTEWLVGAGYRNYEGAIAIPEFEREKDGLDAVRFRRDANGKMSPVDGRRGKSLGKRLRVFPNVKYEDFHRPQTHPFLKPALPWELLLGQEYYFVPSDED